MFYFGAENYDGRLQKISDEDTSKDDLHKASVLSSGKMPYPNVWIHTSTKPIVYKNDLAISS